MSTSSLAANLAAALFAAIIVIDGDTVEQDGQRYRLLGYDTPETGGRARCVHERGRGAAAAEALREELRWAFVSELRPTGRNCKWDRECAHLYVNGGDVAWAMIRRGYARPYTSGKRLSWCAWR
jgi:endonuclease YncB( thermonuclease family)